MKVMQCSICGNQTLHLHDSGVPMICCEKPMAELVAGATDGAQEKHVPAVSVSGATMEVVVGDVIHPMTPEHYIRWIGVEQGPKVQIARLTPDDAPRATFVVEPGLPYTVYEYCNLHGLWKAEGTA